VIKVVFDTNVLISAFAVPGSRSEEAFLLAMRNRISLYTSAAILTETANKLRQKFGLPEEEIIAVLKHVSRTAEIVKPATRLVVLVDEPDNRILECATAAKTDLIMTGDKHLLGLKTYEGIGVCRVADLLRTVGEGELDR
jgi:putative PIN family toxin of toxin-antitoxin system